MTLDQTAFQNMMKERYPEWKVQNLSYKNRPTVQLIEKWENADGLQIKVPLINENPQDITPVFADSQAGSSTSDAEAFVVKRVKKYGTAIIDNETMLATKSDDGAFLRALQTEVEGKINALSNTVAIELFRSGFGERGQIANTVLTGTTVKLVNKSDIRNFAKGQLVVFSLSKGSDLLRNSGTAVSITAMQRDQGSFTISADLSTITGLATSDFIFLKGDRQNSATPSKLCITGFSGWLPDVAPVSGDPLFFGMDRSIDSVRLAGQRIDATGGQPVKQAFYEAAAAVNAEGGNADYVVCGFDNYVKLQNDLSGDRRYVNVKGGIDVGFEAVDIVSPYGTLTVVPDPFCPANRSYVLSRDTWKLASLGKVPGRLMPDNNEAIRSSSLDALEARFGYYANLICTAPGYNAVILH